MDELSDSLFAEPLVMNSSDPWQCATDMWELYSRLGEDDRDFNLVKALNLEVRIRTDLWLMPEHDRYKAGDYIFLGNLEKKYGRGFLITGIIETESNLPGETVILEPVEEQRFPFKPSWDVLKYGRHPIYAGTEDKIFDSAISRSDFWAKLAGD